MQTLGIRNRAPLLVAAGLALVWGSPALAREALGTFNSWTAFSDGNGTDRYCYMVATPRKSQLADRRGDIFTIVTHWPGDRKYDVIQVEIGYPLKAKSEVEVVIDRKTWKLFTVDGNAWAYEAKDDKAIVAAMRKGIKMVVKGTSARGNATSDEYSLKGVTRAHKAIGKACGAS